MEIPIPVVLIEVSPFLLLATIRALARGPETLRGGVEGSPHFWGGIATATNADTGQHPATSKFMANVLSQELYAKKQNPVENFGAPEAIISMHASTKNAI